ncbi:MAG: glycoside hydrolase family 57 protein [Bacteroidales bacterium]|nr:glycoside hydrolase family 57 protein [Bacteroidales bacterium]
MKNICLHFSVHQPFQLRSYRFFDIGQDHYYYDDFTNRSNALTIAKRCYIPMNNLLLSLIHANKKAFKVSFSISGSALEQFEMYTPEVLNSFKQLAATGCVEFVVEPDNHSLVSVANQEELELQIQANAEKIEALFGQKPKTFCNTGLVYSDELGKKIYDLGFHTILAEGADQILGWKSANYVYCDDAQPRMKVLLRNYKLTDDVALRFSNQGWSEWPLTADKYVGWVASSLEKEDVVNLFFQYETFGDSNRAETGIFDFFSAFVAMIVKDKNIAFATPSEVVKNFQPISVLSVPQYTSCADEERDLSAWLGNNLQKQAFDAMYSLQKTVRLHSDSQILADWNRLQSSENLRYMSTKFFSNGKGKTPYQTPYEAFINFMNVLSDFTERVNALPAETKMSVMSAEELDSEIAKYTEILKELENAKKNSGKKKPVVKKTATKKVAEKAEKPAKTVEKKKTATATKKKVTKK